MLTILSMAIIGFVIGLSGMFIFEERNWKWWTWTIVLNLI